MANEPDAVATNPYPQLATATQAEALSTPQPAHPLPFFQAPMDLRSLCKHCPFKAQRRVLGRGDPASPIVLVGESPGLSELRDGIPFTGPSGTVLWSAMPYELGPRKEFGIDKDTPCLVTNALMCHPLDKDPAKLATAVASCHERLITQILQHPRKVIIPLGNVAVAALTGTSLRITKVRGQPIRSPYAEHGLLPCVHPAALLRGSDSYRVFKEDLRYGLNIAKTGTFKQPIVPQRKVCEDEQDVAAAFSDLNRYNYVASDFETSGFNPRRDNVLSLGLAGDPNLVYIVPDHLVPALCDRMPNRRFKLIWHNGKFDVQWAPNLTTDEDTMLQSYTLDESPRIHDLERVANDLLGAEDWKHKIKPWVKRRSDSFSLIPRPILYEYQSHDVSNTLQIWNKQKEYITESKAASKLYYKTLIPLSALLTQVEQTGMYVDQQRVEELGNKYVGDFKAFQQSGYMNGGELYDLELQIQEIAGYGINPNSPIQLSELMFDVLRLEQIKGRSTDKEVLKRLNESRNVHPLVPALTNYRKAQKSFATYVKSIWYFSNVYEADGSIHCILLIHGTRTGRLAARQPNLQNIPRDPLIRGMFIARPGYILIEIDLNQAELRSLAELSDDEYLIGLFNSNTRNLHDEMSEHLFPGWSLRKNEWQGKEERMRAKAVNFGIPYGREAGSIAEEFQVGKSTAQQWINSWFRKAPKAHKFLLRCAAAATRGQTITTCFGRRKHHWLVTRENLKDLQNEARNFPHQVIASDINNHTAMALQLESYYSKTSTQIQEYGARIVNLVHDSLLIECPDDPATIREVSRLGKETTLRIAREWGLNKVPFLSDVKIGKRWGSLVPEEKYFT